MQGAQLLLHKFKQSQVVLSRTDKLLAKFLILRKRLWAKLILLNELTALHNPNSSAEPKPDLTPETLKSFCDLLIDYSSQAHLSIYGEIEAAVQQRHPHLPFINKILINTLEATLDTILAFDYQYPLSHMPEVPKNLEVNKRVLNEALNTLGEQLATRYRLENRIFSHYKKLMKQAPTPTQSTPDPSPSKRGRSNLRGG